MTIYLAGPITKGDQIENIRVGVLNGLSLMAEGHTVYIPHLSKLADLICPTQYEDWMAHDFRWIEKCDVLIRMSGESKGADREVAFAIERGIPVYYGVDKFLLAHKGGI